MRAAEAERGSAPAEFVMVGGLLVLLVLGVLQLGLALLVRNIALDAAAEGARWAALAGNDLSDGRERTASILAESLGLEADVRADRTDWRGRPATVITVSADLPLIGLLGPSGGLEVAAHAAVETIR